MKYLKKISCTVLLTLFFLTTNVWAAGMNDMLISEKGMQIYAIPAGPQGKDNCDLYVYVEMIGDDGKPYIDENWTLEGQVVRKTDDVTGVMEEFQISTGQTGFLNNDIIYATKAEYKDLEMTITIKNGEEVLEEKIVTVADVLLSWPSLSVEKWETQIAQGEEEVKTALVFDWNNTELFKRLFQVGVENSYKELEVNQKTNGTWELVAKDALEGELLVQLTDDLGNTQQYTYKIEVEKQTMSMLWIVLVVAFVVLVAGALFLSNSELREKIKKHGERNNINGDELDAERHDKEQLFTKYIRKFTEEKKTLQKIKSDCDKEEASYKAKLENNKQLLAIYGRNTEYADDLEQFRLYQHLELEIDYEKLLKVCDQAVSELRDAPTNVKKWEHSPSYYDNKINNLQSEVDTFKKSVISLQNKIINFDNEKEGWKNLEKVEKQPLQMPVSITIKKGAAAYLVNVSHNDSAFVLDEKVVLEKDFESSKTITLQEALGQHTDIKVVARPEEKSIVLLCPKKNLRLNGRIDTEFLVKKNSIKTFEFVDESGIMEVDTY